MINVDILFRCRPLLRYNPAHWRVLACLLGLALPLAAALPASAQGVRPALAVGDSHILALRTDGTVWAWGENFVGQLGNTAAIESTLPMPVDGIAGAVAVAAGSYHSLALLADGELRAWGNNSSGQLGDGTNTGRSTPTRVQGLTDVVAIAADVVSTLALKRDGTVWAWGDNYLGQLGLGDTTNRSLPTRIEGLSDVVGISFGRGYSGCGAALKGDGTVWTWGNNYSGQLGDGTRVSRFLPVQINIDQVTCLTAGAGFFFAERTDGSVWAWGNNYYGQLGDGTTIDRLSPAPAATLQGYSQLTGGWSHALGLTTDGTLHGWGMNYVGEIGDGSRDPRLTPVAVNTLPANVVAVSAGMEVSAAVTNDGRLWTWGDNSYGLLGRGMSGTAQPYPQKIFGLTAASVAAGGMHSLAIADNGTVWAWGDNQYGQLGDGGVLASSAEPLALTGLEATAVAACARHSLALTATGEVYVWGENYFGKLGDGSTTQRNTPTKIPTLDRIAAVGCGDDHSVALGQDGRVWTWGNNGMGQLGDRRAIGYDDISIPIALSGLVGVQAIAVGTNYTMALTIDGTVYTWGANTFGQLGDVSSLNYFRAEPTPVMFAANAIVACGYTHTFARRTDGNWYGWGDNSAGQLDSGNINNTITTPTQLTYYVEFSSLTANTEEPPGDWGFPQPTGHILGITASGDLWGWGNNQSGQLGDADLTWQRPLQQIAGVSGVRQVAVGKTHTLALTTTGEVWSWGDNSYGKLGQNIDFSVPAMALNDDLTTAFNVGPYSADHSFETRASVSGPEITPTIEATLTVAAADQGRFGKIYAAGLFPDGRLYFLSPNGWLPYDGGAVPEYAQTTLGNHVISLWSGNDTTGLANVVVYVGYGLDERDLLDNHKYFQVHTMP